MSEEDDLYRVGRGRPPLHSRFKAGQSGNPRGRPKGRKSIEKMLSELLDQTVSVGVGNRRRHVTRLEAMFMQQVQSALKGDRKAIEFLLATRSTGEAGSGPELTDLSAEDEVIYARHFATRSETSDESR